MTDPNYWLSAWLAFMALFNLRVLYMGVKHKMGKDVVFAITLVVGCLVSMLYCAGFVVVMP